MCLSIFLPRLTSKKVKQISFNKYKQKASTFPVPFSYSRHIADQNQFPLETPSADWLNYIFIGVAPSASQRAHTLAWTRAHTHIFNQKGGLPWFIHPCSSLPHHSFDPSPNTQIICSSWPLRGINSEILIQEQGKEPWHVQTRAIHTKDTEHLYWQCDKTLTNLDLHVWPEVFICRRHLRRRWTVDSCSKFTTIPWVLSASPSDLSCMFPPDSADCPSPSNEHVVRRVIFLKASQSGSAASHRAFVRTQAARWRNGRMLNRQRVSGR